MSRLGDPHLSIRLLLHVAREEGKQGRLDRAEGRLNAARALLVSHPNSWLEGVLALDASQIAFAQSKLFEGIAHAEQALRYRVWSRGGTRTGAVANIGLLSLYAGDLPRAEKYLHEGLQLGSNMKELLVPLLDNYAQLKARKGGVRGV